HINSIFIDTVVLNDIVEQSYQKIIGKSYVLFMLRRNNDEWVLLAFFNQFWRAVPFYSMDIRTGGSPPVQKKHERPILF
ncbi:MAG: hypothetical protein ACFFEW_18455, partial [Candidatus Thorarchaeota archaeon]